MTKVEQAERAVVAAQTLLAQAREHGQKLPKELQALLEAAAEKNLADKQKRLRSAKSNIVNLFT